MNEEASNFEKKLEPFQGDFAHFTEIGFTAVKHSRAKDATSLFRAAEVLRPTHPLPVIGYGDIALCQMQTGLAKHIFENVLKKYPENLLAQMFLGIAHAATKKDDEVLKAEELIKDALGKSEDPAIKNLGEVSLKWIEHDLKAKKSTPLA